jgi:hypothetical protein
MSASDPSTRPQAPISASTARAIPARNATGRLEGKDRPSGRFFGLRAARPDHQSIGAPPRGGAQHGREYARDAIAGVRVKLLLVLRPDLGLVVEYHVLQRVIDFQLSVVFDVASRGNGGDRSRSRFRRLNLNKECGGWRQLEAFDLGLRHRRARRPRGRLGRRAERYHRHNRVDNARHPCGE